MIQCLIVDDEPPARKILENYISRSQELELAGICTNAVDAYKKIHEYPIAILFLDIKMPLIDGLSFLKSLKTPPAVIFTTAFSEHAVESYELNAVDYLLKPFSYNRFRNSIEKVLKLSTPASIPIAKEYLFIKADNQLIKLFHKDILAIQARKDYLKIITQQGQHLTHMTMKNILSLLPPGEFVRVHRSYIVARLAITAIGKNFLKINSITIPTGERYKEQWQQLVKSIQQ